MTIRTRLLLWFFPVLSISASAIVIFAYINDIYELIPHKNAFAFMLIAVLCLTLIVLATVLIAAHKISRPVHELNSAALAIAAGDYGKTVEVCGPREISELAQTLSTMSLCLEEQIHRLRENSLARERLYGEYECSLLLQHHLLQKVVDEFVNKKLSVRLIKVTSSTILNGYLFEIEEENDTFYINVAEAKEKGFLGIFDLLRDRKEHQELKYPVTKAQLKKRIFTCTVQKMAPPIIWSTKQNALSVANDKEVGVEPGDLIFFYNKGFAKQFQRHQLIQSWFSKVLRHFASESFDSFAMVLTNELNFLANKQHIPDDMYILCLRIESKS